MPKKINIDDNNLQYRTGLQQLGNNIKQVRMTINMSQYDLAVACNMEKSAMSRIEAGKSNITFFTFCRIAGALNYSLPDLLTIPKEAGSHPRKYIP